MKRLCLLLAALLLLVLAGCAAQNDPPVDDVTPPVQSDPSVDNDGDDTPATPKIDTAAELVGRSGEEILAIYGTDYTAVTPEGDPPYFFYDAVPYHFIGKPTDAVIQAVSSDVTGTPMLFSIGVGERYETLADAAAAWEGYTFREPASWYDDGFGRYGWAQVIGETLQYSCYIKDDVLVSFECRLKA